MLRVSSCTWWGKRSRHSQRMRNPQYYVSGKRPMVSRSKDQELSYILMDKGTVHHPKCNEIASQSFFTTILTQIITALYWHFAVDFVSVLSNGHALWTSILTFIAEVFCCVLGCQKNTFIDLSPFAAYLCDMPRLTLDACLRAIGELQGCTTQADVANPFGVHRHNTLSRWTRSKTWD